MGKIIKTLEEILLFILFVVVLILRTRSNELENRIIKLEKMLNTTQEVAWKK